MLNNLNEEKMQTLKVWHWLAMQGLGVLVMAVGLYVLYNERQEAAKKVSDCNERVIQLYAKQSEVIDKIDKQVALLTALFEKSANKQKNGKKN